MNSIKFIYPLLLFFLPAKMVFAQSLAINTDGSTANTSALLDVKSTAKGVLIPRMTSVQRAAIGTPANGLMVYDTDSLSFAYYNGSAWSFLKGTLNTSTAWTLKGNAGTNAATNFIGTTDGVALKFRVNNFESGEMNHISENTFFGYKSGLGFIFGQSNTAIGTNTLQSTDGSFNTVVGYGAMSTASTSLPVDNTAIGHRSMADCTGGNGNVGIGSRSLNANVSGNYNIGVGVWSLANNASGQLNIGIGHEAMFNHKANNGNIALGHRSAFSDTSGFSNVAIGPHALYSNINRGNLVAIGDSALYSNGTGSPTASQAIRNVAVGSKALYSNSTGYENTAIGFRSGWQNTTGYRNTSIGFNTLRSNTTGRSNVAIGADAMFDNISGLSNVAVGNNALINNSSGSENTTMGTQSLATNSSGNNNVAIGVLSLNDNFNGNSNVAIGHSSLFKNTKSNQVAIGDSALYNNSFGATLSGESIQNTAVGSKALYTNTKGSANTASGFESLYNNTTGYGNIAVGVRALFGNTTRSSIVAIGDSSLYNNGTGATIAVHGTDNTAVGSKALMNNTLGHTNVAVGNRSLISNIDGTRNVAVGAVAMFGNNFGVQNTVVGTGAMSTSISGSDNVALGYQSLLSSNNGYYNTAVGSSTMSINNSGSENVALGFQAGNTNTTGSGNTLLGTQTDVGSGTLSKATAIGYGAYVTANNSMVLGSINGINGATNDTKVGIGVTDPSEKLEIGKGRLQFRGSVSAFVAHGINWTNYAGATDRAFLGMESDDFLGIYNYGFGAWNIRVHNTSGEMGINKQPGTTPGESRLQIKQTGSTGALRAIGIETAINTNRWDIWVDNNAGPDFNFNYNGAIRGYIQNATGNYIVSSDRRLKKDILPVAPALTNLLKMPVYTFRYISNTQSDPLSIGFMAQDVQKFYPDATPAKTDEKGEERLGLNYQAITALAVKAIQEQQQIIDDQNKQIGNLQTQIDELKKLIKKD